MVKNMEFGSVPILVAFFSPYLGLWNSYSVHVRPLVRVCSKKYFSYFSTKTYVVGTQKNRLNETVLLSTHNIGSNQWVRKY